MLPTLDALPKSCRKLLVRVDFNVPIQEGEILDDSRIRHTLATLERLLSKGHQLVLLSHLGRPKGKPVRELSLRPCAIRLSQLLGHPVAFDQESGNIRLLENLRFFSAEESPEEDPFFAKKLAHLGDGYVNEAFSASHRAHSSIFNLANCFPGRAAAGIHFMNEVRFLKKELEAPQRPFYAILGGAKLDTKLGLVDKLLEKVDGLFLGSALAMPFFKKKELSPKIHLPIDGKRADGQQVSTALDQEALFDIGPKTIAQWSLLLRKGKTLLWNGPVGKFEDPRFATGTQAIAQLLATSDAMVIAGGGETVAALRQEGLSDRLTHVSMGGGATLELLEKGTLPGIEVLQLGRVSN